jgi:hypothetical protein
MICGRIYRVPNPLQWYISAADDEVVVETEHIVAIVTQPLIAGRIMAALVFVLMRPAIQLYDQPMLDAEKIRDIIPDRDLSPKFQAVEPRAAQGTPEDFLRVRHLAPQPSRESGFGFRDSRRHCEDPHPTRLRRATFSHEWEKDARPTILVISPPSPFSLLPSPAGREKVAPRKRGRMRAEPIALPYAAPI